MFVATIVITIMYLGLTYSIAEMSPALPHTGGAYSFARYAGIERHTKDMDLFLRRADRERALAALSAVGFRTEVTYEHWLAKARRGEFFIDLIDGSGNGICRVVRW